MVNKAPKDTEKDYLRISPKWAAIIVSILLSVSGAFIASGISFIYLQFQVSANTAELEYRKPAVYGIEQLKQRISFLERAVGELRADRRKKG